ncbi:thiol:disulfide interchange protein DsbA/DsbL [Oceanisphaera avium]|uniref:Thiol:disulfide interchange protein n=1 Tax=Oceanisphaera avium TaxID=1903694 RepID=A0A1Y0D0B2_9GAMM|nr:thiol:disulfide interchange protein DsbA/DsbL [Oceanisphaera avium]ART80455.1 thiol:disulfide interchange protein [Oceanisphaera avium]
MKKYIFILFSLVLSSVQAAQFEEGVEYKVVQGVASNEPIVVEFFSYVCPHCYTFEPMLEKLEARLPDMQLKKTPVAFLGGEMGPILQRAYAAAVLLKVEDTMSPVLFDAMIKAKKKPSNMADIKALFIANDVSEKKFDSVINSFMLNGMISQYDKATERFDVHGTPSVIVKNKYELDMGEVGSEERFYQIVEYLLTKDES